MSAGPHTQPTAVASPDRMTPIVRRLLAATPLLVLLAAGPALAQAASAPEPQAPTGGVVTPPAQVDRGMIRPTPNLPAQSTPVIHPRRLRKGKPGVRVVPK